MSHGRSECFGLHALSSPTWSSYPASCSSLARALVEEVRGILTTVGMQVAAGCVNIALVKREDVEHVLGRMPDAQMQAGARAGRDGGRLQGPPKWGGTPTFVSRRRLVSVY